MGRFSGCSFSKDCKTSLLWLIEHLSPKNLRFCFSLPGSFALQKPMEGGKPSPQFWSGIMQGAGEIEGFDCKEKGQNFSRVFKFETLWKQTLMGFENTSSKEMKAPEIKVCKWFKKQVQATCSCPGVLGRVTAWCADNKTEHRNQKTPDINSYWQQETPDPDTP